MKKYFASTLILATATSVGGVGEELDTSPPSTVPGGMSTNGPFRMRALIGVTVQPRPTQNRGLYVTASWFPCDGGCTGDLNLDGRVDSADIGLLIAAWGTDGSIVEGSDVNGDGLVNAADLGLLIGAWGACQ